MLVAPRGCLSYGRRTVAWGRAASAVAIPLGHDPCNRPWRPSLRSSAAAACCPRLPLSLVAGPGRALAPGAACLSAVVAVGFETLIGSPASVPTPRRAEGLPPVEALQIRSNTLPAPHSFRGFVPRRFCWASLEQTLTCCAPQVQVAQGNVGLAFALVIGSGLCTCLGSCVVFCSNLANTKLLAGSLGISAGVMLCVPPP